MGLSLFKTRALSFCLMQTQGSAIPLDLRLPGGSPAQMFTAQKTAASFWNTRSQREMPPFCKNRLLQAPCSTYIHYFTQNHSLASSFRANPTSPISSQHFQYSLLYFPLLCTGLHVVSQLFWSSLPVVTFSSSAFPRCSRPHPLQRAPQETGTSQTVPQFFPQFQKQKLLLLNLQKK